MSVLIRGMTMPKNCYDCPLIRASITDEFYCVVGNGIEEDLKKLYRHRMSDCPLIEVKEPHGRLIDADKLVKETIYNPSSAPYITEQMLLRASTVIEAEGRE